MAFQLSFFKTPKHRVFNYRPRYYDPQKERAEELRAMTGSAKNTEIISDTTRLRHLRSRMHQGFQQIAYHNRRHAGNHKVMRFIVLLSLAALLVVLFYFSSLMEVLFTSISR